MKGWEWRSSGFAPCEHLPLSDRGFRYGMSLFVSFRVEGGVAEFFDRHCERLIQACAEREFAVEEGSLAQAAALFEPDASGFGRIYVTAGDGPPSAPGGAPRIFVLLEERQPPDADEVWELCFHDESCSAAGGAVKTGNYWFHCEALAQARRRKCDEALLFNDRAELVSACMANVFLVLDGDLATPSRASGARPGVIREWVLNRRKVQERRLRREDVLRADEIFLTNSWVGVMPAATLEGRPLGPRSIGPRLAAELQSRREPPAPASPKPSHSPSRRGKR